MSVTRSQRADIAQATAPDRTILDLSTRKDADVDSGKSDQLEWGSRSDVGLVREHNEDSYACMAPLFAVSDGMGGHAAGEVASSIAIHALAADAPNIVDDSTLGAAIEKANKDVIDAPKKGQGKVGMGCTLTAARIIDGKMNIAHVGDSRCYLLHKGTLVRLTHDHSFVEELVDAGEISADEARVHPSRSIITRALGSDPDMYADHFTVDVEVGERVILCSDGLSSMVDDGDIEDICSTSPSPQTCADSLVSAALVAGGFDNISVVVIDVVDDGKEAIRRKAKRRVIYTWIIGVFLVLASVFGICAAVVNSSYYLGTNGSHVAIYSGVNSTFMGLQLSQLNEVTDVETLDLPDAVQSQLANGISVASLDEAHSTVESYKTQIESEKQKAKDLASTIKPSTITTPSAIFCDLVSSKNSSTSLNAKNTCINPQGVRR